MLNIRRTRLIGAILMALMGAMSGSASATTPPLPHITFKYEGWTPSEQATLESWGQETGPVMKAGFEVSGRPQHNLTITIIKSKPGEYTGDFEPGSGREHLASLRLSVYLHETIGHAIRSGWTLSDAIWEEGLARTAEKQAMLKLAEQGITEEDYDLHHEYTYDVYYDNDNVAGVGVPNGNIYAEPALMLLRYDQAEFALGKSEIENPGFVAGMNAQVFKHPNGNLTPEELVAMAAVVQPMVEGKPFSEWASQQHIFDTTVKPGCELFNRVGQFTTDAYCTDGSGSVTMREGIAITQKIINFKKQVIFQETKATGSYGWVTFQPTMPQANERLMVVASAQIDGHMIESLSWRQSGEATGVFGVVTNASSGQVTFRFHSPKGELVQQTVKVKRGAFVESKLTSVRGLIEAEFRGGGKTALRKFVKDAAPYSLVLTAAKATQISSPATEGPAEM